MGLNGGLKTVRNINRKQLEIYSSEEHEFVKYNVVVG